MADILWLESTSSTNELMRTMDCPPSAIAAFSQTEGRGRLGRTFVSPQGGVYISILVRGDAVDLSSCQVTARAAVAVRRALMAVAGVDAGIKWVNDLYIGNRKVCGILAQTCEQGVVVGVGINWDTPSESFPQELRDKAGSVFSQDRGREEKKAFGVALVREMEAVMTDPSWLEEYREADILVGKKVDIVSLGKVVGSGVVLGIDDSAALRVAIADKEVVLTTGEVGIVFEKDAI